MENKKNNFKKIFKLILQTIFIFTFLTSLALGTFFIANVKDSSIKIEPNQLVRRTIIYDDHLNEVELLGEEDSYTKIGDIPQVMIDALLSTEDKEFYYHEGFNPKRIFFSFINNIFSSSTQGGSTITQQLIKNTTLTNEKTYSRKIKEAYLSFLMEQDYSKEEILELYFNKVYFEQSAPGINYASKAFFNKKINQINYIEAAILAALVKSPSYYYPFSYPERTNQRKNLVLKSMLDNNAITLDQYQLGIGTPVEKLLYYHDNELSSYYDNQAYLDLVYEEVKAITGKDLYTHPIIVETYLDTYLQKHIDLIQNDKIISFTDDNQQIGGVVLKNEEAQIIGIIGGRNYYGKKLFNRGFHLKRNPASTIKPLLSYALGMEYLNLHPLSTIKDEPYSYQGTNININNADKKYLGNLSVIESLGYSRNTSAVRIFDRLVSQIGINKIEDYLNNINVMDNGNISSSYALGGMSYGISPLQLAGGYCTLANHGQFIKPSTIKRIKDFNGKVIYERKTNYQKVLSEESADMITYSLNKVINNNYLNINIAKPKGIEIAGKTGTNAYDKATISNYNLPKNADKDIWFAGYSPSHTAVIWTGFDNVLEKQNYFTSNDSRKKIAKLIFKSVMEQVSSKDKFSYSNNLKEIALVKHLEDNYLPNENIPSSFIEKTLVNPNDINVKSLPDFSIEAIDEVDIFSTKKNIVFQVKTPLIEDLIYSTFYGEKIYLLTIITPSGTKEEILSKDGYFEYEFKEKGKYIFTFSITFENNTSLHNTCYRFTYHHDEF